MRRIGFIPLFLLWILGWAIVLPIGLSTGFIILMAPIYWYYGQEILRIIFNRKNIFTNGEVTGFLT